MLDKNALLDGVYAIGPLAVLCALSLSVVSSAVWYRNVGETSCAWRTDYSPDARAFGIWRLIYIGTVGVVIAQSTNLVVVFDWWVHFLWALAWAFCALWVPLFHAEYPDALRAAMLQLVAAAGCATAAAGLSRMWLLDDGAPTQQRVEQVALGWPLTLFAGWLAAAAAINVGIAAKASAADAAQTCTRVDPQRPGESEASYLARRRVLYREAYARMPVRVSFVPVVLAVLVGGLSTLIQDPLYPVPLMWAILNLPAFPCFEYLVALLLCACGSAGAIVRIFML